MTTPSLDHPFLTRQIIPYIGNKRRLLPLIQRGVLSVTGGSARGMTFADLFAGSGVVSRLAKFLGCEVYANDWEPYAAVVTGAHLVVDARDADTLFASHGGIRSVLKRLNALPPCAPGDEYIARHYSPLDDRHADYRRERLFYTRQNGLRIDAIRNEIERLYPDGGYPDGGKSLDPSREGRERLLLLALLLEEAATHTNTSGVFKAYHKGFGGFSGDALTRIMKPIVLPQPVLIDSDAACRVFGEDANRILRDGSLRGASFDLVYLDPPYNQHQYGSNYHLLNTIALWDKPDVVCRSTGSDKAGIRKDWVKTRSPYCYRNSAGSALEELLDSVDGRWILISYSTEGIIPFDALVELCASRGSLSLFTNEYVTYRGGRQSAGRVNNNVETLLCVDTSKRGSRRDRERVREMMIDRLLNLQCRKHYMREGLLDEFLVDECAQRIGVRVEGRILWLQTRAFFQLDEEDIPRRIEETFHSLTPVRRRSLKEELATKLRRSECGDRAREIEEILRIIARDGEYGYRFISLLPGLLKKIAHRKYRDLFLRSLSLVREMGKENVLLYEKIARQVEEVESLAEKRFEG